MLDFLNLCDIIFLGHMNPQPALADTSRLIPFEVQVPLRDIPDQTDPPHRTVSTGMLVISGLNTAKDGPWIPDAVLKKLVHPHIKHMFEDYPDFRISFTQKFAAQQVEPNTPTFVGLVGLLVVVEGKDVISLIPSEPAP
ncbi:MAG: hypothetical protein RL094_636 [Candidatus Parcubacteria bacterium]|jgi:hypothetical protein